MYFNTPGDDTEQELLEKVAGGNETAFNLLYQKYAGQVYAMGLKYLKSPFLAQDAVQEVFIRVWKNREQLVALKSFPAWLNTVTRNQLIDELQQQIPLETIDPLQSDQLPLGLPYQKPDIDFRELEKLVKTGLHSFSARQQQVYQLSREEGLSHKEIAEKLGISYDMVREHMSKALKNLRSFLEKHYNYPLLLILTWNII